MKPLSLPSIHTNNNSRSNNSNQTSGRKTKKSASFAFPDKNSVTDEGAGEAWDVLSKAIPGSPRTKYLTCCIREDLKPLPNLIIRRDYTTILDLSHFGMGDEIGKVLAESLQYLPFIEAINLNDNNLTDDSLQYLIESIIAIKSLKVLNLSRNKIDGYSSEALSNYVSRPDCPLITLILQNADVDDV